MRRWRLFLNLVALCFVVLSLTQPSRANLQGNPTQPISGNCEKLANLQIPNVTITAARVFAAGAFVSQAPGKGANTSEFYNKLPAFCRVIAVAKPTSDSNITLDVWMPLTGWNGKFDGVGNGGFAGSYDTLQLAELMAKGYAAAATDTGHTGSPIDAAWALGHPEKVIDFGYRGIHEMTRVAKILVEQFYGSLPRHSYFEGCSDGGREALMEAQRYPGDYDGILAGAPANDWTQLLTMAVTDTQALTATPESFISPEEVLTIAHAVLSQCDQLDGVRDGIIGDPRRCKFDPTTIECKNEAATAQCLTTAQVAALKTIYKGLQDGNGRPIFPGFLPGAEGGDGGWVTWITGPTPGRSLMAAFGVGYYSNMVYEKANWGLKSFRMETGLPLAQEKTAGALDAVNPDLKPFSMRKGRLILYQGWGDPAIPALSTLNYYNKVVETVGKANTESFLRLYMVPGMQHCSGGPGPDNFGQSATWNPDPKYNLRTALEVWVENGTAPSEIIATKISAADPPAAPTQSSPPIMTRPLCPYPKTARYKGSGDFNATKNFVCVMEADKENTSN